MEIYNSNGGFSVKKQLKRYISMVLTVLILISFIPINASAWFSDVPEDASYTDALTRLISLGMISGQGKFNPDSPLTREQYARMIVGAAGLEDLAASMKGPTEFPDISATAWSSGYINAAVAKGYIGGMADGKFHPTQAVTYVQLCAFLVKALGYTLNDLTGTFPYSYISKAYELGLTDGITLTKDASVPRRIAVVMIDRFLDTNMKQVSATAPAQTFMETTGSYIKAIVFGDSNTMTSLSKGQVLTDKGTYNNPSNVKLELGSENYLVVKNGNIVKASGQSSVLKVSVEQVAENKVSYKTGDSTQSMMLPENTTYYYKGQKATFAQVTAALQKSSSIVFNYTSDKNGYSFAVVFDPVYGKPEIVNNFVSSSGKLGSINFSGNPQIIKNGDLADISEIVKNDVVYGVSDIWGVNKYILVVDKKVGGKITDVIPNKLSPKTLQIDNVGYDFSKDIDTNKISASNIDLSTGNHITISLGYDGKIVNIGGFGMQDNSDYALVLSSGSSITTDSKGQRKQVFTAKLLFSDGFISTNSVTTSASTLIGKLVKYTIEDSDTMSLEQLSYNLPGSTNIVRNEQLLGNSYVADNVKIFNIQFNDSAAEVTADILKWSDLPEGAVPNGKILYTNTAGAFNDINIILTDDILNQRFKSGIVKTVNTTPSARGYSYVYSILIGATEYTFNEYDTDLLPGAIFSFKMSSAGIDSISQTRSPIITVPKVQAVDSKRIKVNDKIYFFSNDISVYYRDTKGDISAKTIADIDTVKTYQKASLYTNSSDKVNVVYLVE